MPHFIEAFSAAWAWLSVISVSRTSRKHTSGNIYAVVSSDLLAVQVLARADDHLEQERNLRACEHASSTDGHHIQPFSHRRRGAGSRRIRGGNRSVDDDPVASASYIYPSVYAKGMLENSLNSSHVKRALSTPFYSSFYVKPGHACDRWLTSTQLQWRELR